MNERNTMDEDNPTTLTDEQRARAEALAIARAALTDNGQAFVSSNAFLPKRFGTQDLIDVAQWILDGIDPLAAYREEGLTDTEREADRNAAEARAANDDDTIELPVPPPPPGAVQRQQGAD